MIQWRRSLPVLSRVSVVMHGKEVFIDVRHILTKEHAIDGLKKVVTVQ